MDTKTIFAYISEQDINHNALSAIKNGLIELEARAWKCGYTEALRHIRKRRLSARMRRDKAVNNFLDYLSDLTYTPKKVQP